MTVDLEYLEKLNARARMPVTLGENGQPFAYVPIDSEVKSLEAYLDAPIRIRRALIVTTLESFNRYYNEFKDADGDGNSRIYVDQETVSAVGVLDDHQSKGGDDLTLASWCDHRVVYKCPYSRQWEAWMMMDRRKVNQIEFAEWLEDRTQDVSEPSGTDLLALCLDLQIHRRVVYGSARRLETGEHSFSYTEDNETGTVQIPATITLGIPVFQDGTNYAITARFRYRLVEGNLTLWFELVEPQKYVEDAFNEVIEAVKAATETEPLRAKMGIGE
jgi:uncharacterized protein YfdQ (DUF2303 family)